MRRVLIALLVVALVGGAGYFVFTREGDRPSLNDGGDDGDVVDETPVRGGDLRLALERPSSFDPARADPAVPSSLIIADLLFDGLTVYDPDTLDAAPAVASRWKANADRTTWTFTVSEKARFHNGRAIRARDVKVSLQRAADRDTTPALALDVITGFREFTGGDATELEGLEVHGKRTLVVKLDEPMATLPALLANPVFGIVPEKPAKTKAFAKRPVGSGPFRIASREGDNVDLVRAKGADTYVDAVTLLLYDGLADAYAAFEAGLADVSRVPDSLADTAADKYGDDYYAPYAAELFYGFNLGREELRSERLRRAILHAIDRERIADEVYAGVLRLDRAVPSGIPGAGDRACAACDYDPDEARRLLKKEYGKKQPPRIYIDYDNDPRQDAIAEQLRDDLRAVGIPVKLRGRPFDTNSGDDYSSFITSDDLGMFRHGWVASYLSAEAYLRPLFQSESPDNLIHFDTSSVDKLLRKAARTIDAARRDALLRDAERRILADVPIIPIIQFRTLMVARDQVHDLDINALGTFAAERVWLAAE